jgi:hypothetical protein
MPIDLQTNFVLFASDSALAGSSLLLERLV